MFHVVLVEPEIPGNTGNILRLCANTGTRLHLVKPLGFSLSERALRRAGLDYHELASVTLHESWPQCRDSLVGHRRYLLTTKGAATPSACTFTPGDVLVFGAETRGVSEAVAADFSEECLLRLPMVPGSRSMNLANAVAVTVFEAWRQAHYAGAETYSSR